MPSDFRDSPSARESYTNLFGDGELRLPSSHQLTAEVNGLERAVQGDCRTDTETRERGRTFTSTKGRYHITSQAEREALILEIIQAGPNRLGKTRMRMPDGRMYEVMNDNVTLPDGTYVPLTFPEARRIALAWGYQLPNASQAVAIGQAAAAAGNQFRAITRTPNSGEATQLRSMNEMMNDPNMRSRAQAGRDRLIDGHFKWYTNDGKIYGFARGDGRFYQNRPSGAHVGDPSYYDYSHGVRLIRPIN